MNFALSNHPRTAKAARGAVVRAYPALERPLPANARACTNGGSAMFETSRQDDVEALMKADPEFRRLYQHHQELDSKVRDAELGVLPVDDTTLTGMKREKLHAKDRLTRMWDRRAGAAMAH